MENEPISPYAKKRNKLAILYWGILIIILILGFLYWEFRLRFEEYTNDAYVEGNQVMITPLRSGFIRAIHTDDTFLVKKGQLLIELDKTDAVIQLERTKKELAKEIREICQLYHSLFATQAEIEVQTAELIKAAQDYQHRNDALPQEAVSLEDYQHAVAALKAGYFSLKKLESLFEQSLAFLQGTSIKNHPVIQASAQRLKDAYVQHYRCNIYAPIEGIAAQRKIQVGMWINSGDPLLSVIPLCQIWVNANFKETQMKRVRLGQPVKLTSDLYGSDVVYQGRIVGLPGAAGNAFSLLPPQNLSGNWIKIVQRVPVRIAIEEYSLQNHPLRIGLSMEATAYTEDQDGLLVPITTEGSPIYATDIFQQEEKGVYELIDAIMNENIDPLLEKYAQAPLHLEKKQLHPKLKNLLPFE